MPTHVIVVIATAISLLLAVVIWALYVYHIMGVAQSLVTRAQHQRELGELTGDWVHYHKAEFAFKRAARLYFRANQYPSARWFATRSVRMRREVEKYI